MLAARQHGVVKFAQLLQAGIGRAAVSNRVAKGRLHPKYRGVYAVGHARLSQKGEWMAAVLAVGEGAALSHLSAAMLWEIWRRPVLGSDVVTPWRRKPQVGIRVHTRRRLDPHDVAVRDGIPVTTVARTLVDLTDVLSAHQLANVIHEAAFRKRFDPRAVRAAAGHAHGRKRLHVLHAALALHEAGSAGTRSRLEDRFLALLHANDLPEPLVNVRMHNIEVDFRWPALRLCVETDGDGHRRPRTRRDDHSRDGALSAAGYQILRFTEHDVDYRPAAVIAELLQAGLAPANSGILQFDGEARTETAEAVSGRHAPAA